ncbi:high-affinity choline transporter 1-like [Conger conger]|uniref:high-affinity choline transporter 1-like n=1 Tax=Conger conger TaxID=82655 RepID=UPI002A59865A|nr:high-affinity choline transporter 1-like [Conger conger]XP_061111629.1 high-affinity choline transporter 1-like [Conger conger]
MAVNIPGVIAVAVFYMIILATGIWASRRSRQEEKRTAGTGTEVTLIAGRKINITVGIFTMTATWVGGAYIMVTSAATYDPTKGLIWATMPLDYILNFLLAGLFFAKPLREKEYVTMMDPFQLKYGDTVSCALLIPTLISDLLWIACAMASLGGTLSVILDISSFYSICVSAAVGIIYTLLGGMFSVAYTDIIQLLFIAVSMWLCVPFMMLNPASTDITLTAFNGTFQAPWVGMLEPGDVGLWIDEFLVLSLGGLAYQAMHQRILSASSVRDAQVMCFSAAAISSIMGIPSILAGAVAASTNWNMTSYGSPSPYERGEAGKILPIALQHLTPNYISILGTGAVAAAVMSSMDSCLLASASLFTQNIYKALIRKQASDRELQWVIKGSVTVVGLAGMGLSFLKDSVLPFYVLSSDVLYTVILPQLVCVLHLPVANVYGAVGGYVSGVALRLLSGEPLLRLPPVIHFPGCRLVDGVYVQHFPHRSLAMLLSLCSTALISYATAELLRRGVLPRSWDLRPARTDAPRVGCANVTGNADNKQPATSDQLLDTSC